MNARSTGLGGGLLAIGMAALVAACATTEEVKTASRQSFEKTEEVRASLESKIEQINRLQRQAEEQQADLVRLQKQAQDELSAAQRRGAELETRVQEIKGQDLSVVQGQLETMRRDLDGLQSGLDDQKAQGFSLATRLSGVDKRVAETDKTVGQITETVRVIGTKLSAQVEQQAQSLAKLEEAAKQADIQAQALTAQVNEFKGVLTGFTQILRGLEAKATEVDRRVTELAGKTEGKVGALVVQEGERAARLEALKKQIEAEGQSLTAQVRELRVHADRQAAGLDAMEKKLNEMVASGNETSRGLGELKRVLEESIAHPVAPGEALQEASPAPPQQAQPAQRTSILPEPPRPAGAAPRTAPEAALSAEEAYERAQSQYKKGQYDTALTSFKLFLIQYPDSSLVPNAHFWMAECYVKTNDLGGGIKEYDQVVRNYPKSEKASRALYRKAMAFLELNDTDAAKATLRQLIADYPKSEDSKQARTKLASLK